VDFTRISYRGWAAMDRLRKRSLSRIDSGPLRLFNQIRTGLSESSVLERHGVSRDVPSLPDSPHFLSLPGTAVPGYRLFRPRSTSSGQALRDCFVAARR